MHISYFITARVLLIGTSIALVFVSIEGFLQVQRRYFQHRIDELNNNVVILQHSNIPMLGYELKQGVSKSFLGPQGEVVTYTINQDGYRGSIIPVQKDSGEQRILFLGDSITFGAGVDDKQTFARQVEQYYQSLRKNINVINGAVGGYTTLNELIILKEKYIDYKPDIIILGYCLNDADPNSDYVFDESIGGNANTSKFPKTYKGPLSGRLSFFGRFFDNLEVWKLLSAAVTNVTGQNGWYRGNTALFTDGFKRNPEGWLKRKQYLQAIRELADRSGSKFLLVIFPTAYQINNPGEFPEPQQMISEFSKENGIEYIDLLPLFLSKDRDGRDFIYDNIHLTDLGEREVASFISTFLEEKNWID